MSKARRSRNAANRQTRASMTRTQVGREHIPTFGGAHPTTITDKPVVELVVGEALADVSREGGKVIGTAKDQRQVSPYGPQQSGANTGFSGSRASKLGPLNRQIADAAANIAPA